MDHEDSDDAASVILLPDDFDPGPLPFRKLWFDDGTIILRAENSLFRIHRSILCTHSQVFADMFSLSQPEVDELMEGCPVICLPDRASDVAHLLQSLYEPFFFRMHSYSFDYMSAILRLSTKYDIRHLREHAIDKLKQAFPSSLNQFDDPAFKYARDHGEEHALAAILLGRETNCPELLPCAFYYCSRLPLDEIVNGDGLHAFSREDVLVCLKGREGLLTKQREGLWRFMYEDIRRGCVSCKRNTMIEQRLNRLRMSTVPYPLERVADEQWPMFGFCGSCTGLMISEHSRLREELWKKLPGLFGLESWAHFQKDSSSYFGIRHADMEASVSTVVDVQFSEPRRMGKS